MYLESLSSCGHACLVDSSVLIEQRTPRGCSIHYLHAALKGLTSHLWATRGIARCRVIGACL